MIHLGLCHDCRRDAYRGFQVPLLDRSRDHGLLLCLGHCPIQLPELEDLFGLDRQ